MATLLGQNLRQFRMLKGLSLRDVEDSVGVSNAYLSQLERGHAKNPSPRKLELLAKEYSVSYSELLRLAGYLGDESIINGDRLVASSLDEKPASGLKMAIQDAELTGDEENLVAQYIVFLMSQRK